MQYHLPCIEDILTTLNGDEVFTAIDLREAYNQLPLDEESQPLITINTPKDQLRFTCLPFKVALARILFQRRIGSILSGLREVQAYLDDMIIAKKWNDTTTLCQVLQWFQDFGLHLYREKSKFQQAEVDFLRHRISDKGLQYKAVNLEAILCVKQPQYTAWEWTCLGLVKYYHKFL